MLAPLVIAHAACKGHAPENTIAGVNAALGLGVDAIEIDVQATSDGVPVLLHDATVDRTTNGTGAVAQMALVQLQQLDAGARAFDGRFAGERVPTLAEVLDLTRDHCLLVIEIKQRGIERRVADVVRRAGAAASSMVWSFHAEVVEAWRSAMPEVPAAQLWSGQHGDAASLLDATVRRNAQAVSVHFSMINDQLVTAARRRGLSVFTWTPDDAADQVRVAARGVDGICTNLPDVLRTTLAWERYTPSDAR